MYSCLAHVPTLLLATTITDNKKEARRSNKKKKHNNKKTIKQSNYQPASQSSKRQPTLSRKTKPKTHTHTYQHLRSWWRQQPQKFAKTKKRKKKIKAAECWKLRLFLAKAKWRVGEQFGLLDPTSWDGGKMHLSIRLQHLGLGDPVSIFFRDFETWIYTGDVSENFSFFKVSRRLQLWPFRPPFLRGGNVSFNIFFILVAIESKLECWVIFCI